MPERLQKILSAHGVASRREAERMITEGRVAVNGTEARLGQSAEAERDEITVDGVPLKPKDEKLYIMLNKPRGYVTTANDERGRKTVLELVAGAGARVYPVGRLDMDSEGLLIMTNDGEFANAVMHPSFNKDKVYRVRAAGVIESAVEFLRKPMEIDGYTIRPAHVKIIKQTPEGGDLLITIHEGRNRQIRKMCAKCGLTVKSLIRVSIGGLELGGLESGKWRYLTENELKALNREAGNG